MTDRIEQEYLIEATAAINNLRNLDEALANYQKRLRSVSRTTATYNRNAAQSLGATGQLATGVKQVADGLNQVGSGRGLSRLARDSQQATAGVDRTTRSVFALTRQTRDATTASADLRVSFATIGRVISTQLVVSTFGSVKRGLQDSVSEAIELQKQFSVISTIADGATFEQISGSVREISDSLNIDQLESAEALYNALSNQLGTYNGTVQATIEAGKLARTTNSTFAESVDLISGALRAYKLPAEEAARVSAVFFSAIDRGRITAPELANSFGVIGEPARQLGVDLEEVTGSLAGITESGISTARAATQLRGIFNSLNKPSEALKATFQELGVENAKAGIEAFGFAQFLQRLADAAGGSSEKFNDLFKNIRASGGVLGTTNENLARTLRNIEEASNFSASDNERNFATVISTDAEQVTKSLNELKNVFVSDFGNEIVKVIADLRGSDEEFRAFRDTIQSSVPVVLALGKGVVVLGGALGTLAVGAKLVALATALTPLGAAAIAAGTLASALVALNAASEDLARQRAESFLKGLEDQLQAGIEAEKKFTQEILLQREILKEESTKSFQETREAFLANSPFTDETVLAANAKLVNDTQSTLQTIATARRELVKGIADAITSSNRQIEDSNSTVRGLLQTQDDRQFDRENEGFSEAQQAFRLSERATSQARQAEIALRRAFQSGNEEAAELAEAQFDRALATAQRAQQVAGDDVAAEARAVRELEAIENRRIRLEQLRSGTLRQRQSGLRDEQATQQAINENLKDQIKIINDNISNVSANGGQLSESEQRRRAERVSSAIAEITEQGLQGLDVAQALNLTTIAAQLQESLSGDQLRVNVVANRRALEDQLRGLKVSVNLAFNNELELQRKIAELSGGTFTEPSNVSDVEQGSRQTQETADAAATRVAELNEAVQKQEGLLSGLIQTETQLQGIVESIPSDRITDRGQAIIDQISAITDKSAELRQIPNLSFEQVREGLGPLVETLQELNRSGSSGELFTDPKQFNELSTTLVGLVNEFRNLSDVKLPEVSQSDLEILRITGSSLVESGRKFRIDLEAGAQAVQGIGIGTGTVQPNFAGTTGVQRFASGGFARGVDTVPAMLAPGESVINSRSTQRFFSQIQALNAGQRPVFRNSGGTVSVGDINVSMQSSGSAQMDGRAIARIINSEIRKGTVRLRR